MKYFALLFLTFVLAIIVSADRGAVPPFIQALYDFPNGDKFGHFLLFGTLNFLLTYVFIPAPLHPNAKRVALSIGLILALGIGVEEFSQRYFSSRTFDLIDLTLSYLGVFVGGWIAFKLKERQAH